MMEYITPWLQTYENVWIQLGALSAGLFIFSLLLLPWLVSRIPADYFQQHTPRQMTLKDGLSIKMWVRNALGIPVLLAGIVMLVLPGQGILTIILGIAIMDFPGKYRLEQRLVRIKGVLTAINWCRQRFNVPAITLP